MEWLIPRACIFLAITIDNKLKGDIVGYNWEEASQHCEGMNKSLPLEFNKRNAVTKHWTKLTRRLSSWIQIKGCFDENRIDDLSAYVFILSESSVGLCQELCLQKNRRYFALQMETCICLLEEPTEGKQNTGNCSHSCRDFIQDNPFKDCGGNKSFNVFKTEHLFDFRAGSTTNEPRCLSIQCTDGDNGDEYFKFNCGDTLIGFCANSTISNKNWNNAMSICKNNHSAYLYGNANLSDAKELCQHNTVIKTSQHWIGVAMQEFNSQNSMVMDGNVLLECRWCNAHSCNYSNCLQSLDAVCVNKADVDIPSSSRTTTLPKVSQFETSESASTDFSTVVSSSPFATTQMENDTATIAAAVTVVIIVVLGGVAIVILIIIRKRKLKADTSKSRGYERENHLDKHVDGNLNYTMPNKHSKSQETNKKEYEEAKNDYFVLEPAADCYELADNIILEQENPYTDGEDGTYDQLRNTKVRKREEEDTYQHATLTEVAETSDYDTTSHMKRKDIDSTYDHANANMILSESDNPYNSLENV